MLLNELGDFLKMKAGEFFGGTTNKMKNPFVEMVLVDKSIMNEIVTINIKRLFYVAIVAMPVNLLHIIIFSKNMSLGGENEINWRIGIILCHTMLFLIMGILGCFSFFLRKKEKFNVLKRLIQYIAIVIILSFGVTVVTVDQLVTSNITPFLVACTISSVIFLIRPLFIIPVYLSAFFAFYFSIALTQMDQEVLLSNRVNGITVIGIGICLSLILWKVNVSNILQKRFILNQKQELVQMNQELEFLAFNDSMTHLYNRRKFEELLNMEISKIHQNGHKSCLIILDIDYFKKINDLYGHPVGDRVIKHIASILRENARETDVVSRWGGEEFLLLLPHTSLSEGRFIAEKLRKIIEDRIVLIKEKEIHITASFGVAGISGDKDSLELAYKDADKALYVAKEKGRNCVETAYIEDGVLQ